MSVPGWTTRMGELGLYRPTGIAWDKQLWPLMALAERTKGTRWLQEQLWELKFASWILHLDQQRPAGHKPGDTGRLTCNACGARIDNAHRLSRYCSVACRKVAHRRRQAGQPTDWEAQVEQAASTLAAIRREMSKAHRWWKHQHQRGQPPAIPPPNLTRVDHLPWTPPRCGNGCTATSKCAHTKATCLFAATGTTVEGDEDGTG